MLLAFICITFALCAANPLHKFPYVFLLDVGNEELEKTNTEQLRITIPGGSLSMKYPATGDGEPITHVRVSGIDFGADLKVNIVGGGPGFRYVVLTFKGNPGVTYDAVVTLQTFATLPSVTETSIVTTDDITNKNINPNSYEVSEADSDDADVPKDPKKQYSKSKSKEVMQSTSTFYNYVKGKLSDGDSEEESQNVSSEEPDDDDDDSDDDEDETDSDISSEGENVHSSEEESKLSNQEERASVLDKEDNDGDENVNFKMYRGAMYGKFEDIPRAEQYRSSIDPNNPDNDKPADIVDDSLYEKYQALKPHLGVGFRVYPQSFIYDKQYEVKSDYNKGDPVEFEQMFNDEEVHNDARFQDGSNSIDSDYPVAEY